MDEPRVTQPSKAPKGGLLGALFWPLRLLKRLYAWVVGWAETKWGMPALVVLSFVESSFFPIPPDPLLIALCLGKRKRSLWYAFACTAASVAGGVLGWLIGMALFDWVVDVIRNVGATATWFGTPESAAGLSPEQAAALPSAQGVVFYPDGYFHLIKSKFDENAFLAYFTAALTPIPYKAFTIAGGVFSVSLPMLILGSIVGRGMRFFGLGVLVYAFGDKVKPIIEKYFEWITIGVCVLIAVFFVLLKYAL